MRGLSTLRSSTATEDGRRKGRPLQGPHIPAARHSVETQGCPPRKRRKRRAPLLARRCFRPATRGGIQPPYFPEIFPTIAEHPDVSPDEPRQAQSASGRRKSPNRNVNQ